MSRDADRYSAYYANQCGGEIGSVYRASYKVQRGRGLGNFLAGLFRFFKPLLTSGLRTFGKEAATAGIGILSDLGTQPVKDIIRSRINEAGNNLKRKAEEKIRMMSGSGLRIIKKRKRGWIKRGTKEANRHLIKGKRRGQHQQHDIFS